MTRGRYQCGRCGSREHNVRRCTSPTFVLSTRACRCGAVKTPGYESCALCRQKARHARQTERAEAERLAAARAAGQCDEYGCDAPGWRLKGGQGRVRCLKHLPLGHPERLRLCVEPLCTHPPAVSWEGRREVVHHRCRRHRHEHEAKRRDAKRVYDENYSRFRRGPFSRT